MWMMEFCPPNFVDLSPLHCYAWGVVGSVSTKKPLSLKDALKTVIRGVMDSMKNEIVAGACSHFRSRLQKVIEVNGGFNAFKKYRCHLYWCWRTVENMITTLWVWLTHPLTMIVVIIRLVRFRRLRLKLKHKAEDDSAWRNNACT